MKKTSIIFKKQLWHSYIIILKHFFRSITVKRVRGIDFFTEEKYQEFKQRIEKLTDRNPAKWGTMRADEMIHHLNLTIGSGLGLYHIPDKSNIFTRTIIKWILINWFSEQPQGLQLFCLNIPKQEHFDFESEKTKLLALMDVATTAESQNQWHSHYYFGRLSVVQWGKLCTIQLDYYLRQFSL